MWNYSNTSTETTLVNSITPSSTTITPASLSGFPVSFPYTLIIDFGQPNVEVVTVTGSAGPSLTVVRGEDGTATQSHNAGAVVVHGVVARDVREPQAHIDASSNVHGVGVGSAVVGTGTAQALTNKTISGANNTLTQVPDSALTTVSGTKIVNPFGYISSIRNTTDDPSLETRVTGDASARAIITAGGTIRFGPGNIPADVNLYRSAANTLKTDDTLEVASDVLITGRFDVTRALSGNHAFRAVVTGDAFERYLVTATGFQQWGPGNAALDTNLFRAGANLLKTDDTFEAADLVVGGRSIPSETVRRFANAAARTAAITSPVEGMLCYLQDVNRYETYDGTNWVSLFGPFAFKTSNTSRANDTDFDPDPDLTVAAASNAVYTLDGLLIVNADDVAQDIKVRFAFPAGSTLHWGAPGGPAEYIADWRGDSEFAMNQGATTSPTTALHFGVSDASFETGVPLRGLLVTGGTAGNLELQWGQVVAGVATTLYAGSWMALTRRA